MLSDSSSDSTQIPYLSNLSNKELRHFFSLDTYVKVGDQRSRNYEKHYKYVYSGCSETTGEFLSKSDINGAYDYAEVKHNIWGDLVGVALDEPSRINLSVGGASVMGIVNMIIRQIRTYGQPDHVLVLFPSLDSRITFVPDSTRLVSLSGSQELVSDISGIGEYETTYSKQPHVAENILSKRWVTYLNTQSILMLEELCRASGINLIYSTWSKSTHEALILANSLAVADSSPVPFRNYIVSDYRKAAGECLDAARLLPTGCHTDFSDHPRWYIGANNTHMGVHAHMHVADLFSKELQNRGFPDKL